MQASAEDEFAILPESALRNVEIDYVLPVGAIGPLLMRLVSQSRAAPEAGSPVISVPSDRRMNAG